MTAARTGFPHAERQVSADSQDGFSTLEAIVAFAVLAIALGVAIEAISLASGNLRRARQEARAAEIARTVLAQDLPQLLAASRGEAARRSSAEWELDLTPLREEGARFTKVVLRVAPAGDGHYARTYLTFTAPAP